MIQRRIHDVEGQIRNLNRETQAEELSKYDAELLRQQSRLTSAQQEHQALARVHTALKMWIDQLPINARFVDCISKCRPAPDENYDTAVSVVRHEIDDAQGDLGDAPRGAPVEDLYAQADAYVTALAAQANAKIHVTDGKLTAKLPERVVLSTLALAASRRHARAPARNHRSTAQNTNVQKRPHGHKPHSARRRHRGPAKRDPEPRAPSKRPSSG